ncbi:MAG: nucleotide exchange factor GrpE [Thaumarchaeota archaeon]|jgi:molecular chaperone GrpE|nr:nucleotide exchange factor GrpE [Nitrososphaerota archaeon]|tara:strand:- start:6832 stop:7368 length:537 start_codon:yes stop_codon:yes gene_type:complete
MLIENNEQNIPLDSAEDDYSKDEFEKIKKQSDSYFKQLQYLQADFENFRKQTNKEFENQSKFGKHEMVRSLIEIYEDLQRILENANTEDSSIKGIQLVIKNIEAMFEEQSVELIDSVGSIFDPNLHEAVDYTKNSDFEDNVIISEIQSGYKIHGQVLRPSKVNVCNNKVDTNGVNINE